PRVALDGPESARGPEGEAARHDRKAPPPLGFIERGPIILDLSRPRVVPAVGKAHAPEVEPQGGVPASPECPGGAEDHLAVHRPALTRMGMREDRATDRVSGGLLPETLQSPGRARKHCRHEPHDRTTDQAPGTATIVFFCLPGPSVPGDPSPARAGESPRTMKKIVHVVGTGTIGEPLIGLFADFKKHLGIDEITFHKRTPMTTERAKANHLRQRGAKLAVDSDTTADFEALGHKVSFESIEALERATVVIDCTPAGNENKKLYEKISGPNGFLAQGSEFGFGKPYAIGINEEALIP